MGARPVPYATRIVCQLCKRFEEQRKSCGPIFDMGFYVIIVGWEFFLSTIFSNVNTDLRGHCTASVNLFSSFSTNWVSKFQGKLRQQLLHLISSFLFFKVPYVVAFRRRHLPLLPDFPRISGTCICCVYYFKKEMDTYCYKENWMDAI